MNPATSENMCAASVRMAREPEMIPPANSKPMNMKQMNETKKSFFIARFPCSNFFLNFASCSKAHLLSKCFMGCDWNLGFLLLS